MDTRSAPAPEAPPDFLQNSASVELASQRTSLAFERTRMGADRTLMASVRTALSLISFGFTINEIYQQLREKVEMFSHAIAAHYFGLVLVFLGVALLTLAILGHRKFLHALTARKERLRSLGLTRRMTQYQPTPTFIIALLLLFVGIAAAFSIIWRSVLY